LATMSKLCSGFSKKPPTSSWKMPFAKGELAVNFETIILTY
jgi:hypothetical protein